MPSLPRLERGGFLFQALANGVGTLMAAGVVYLIALMGGVISAVPIATALSVAGLTVGIGAILVDTFRQERIFRRARRRLRHEPEAVTEPLRRTGFVPSDASDAQVVNAITRLPKREKFVLLLRFGERMKPEELRMIFGNTRAGVRQLEREALERLQVEVAGEVARGMKRTRRPD